ncbi:putative calpain-like cysteine peptidase putative cysteine peptidase Clan CA family C2 [Leptomonas seymouri]|uniref:Putative calpain-like cysteine peptidase putative cysteine peptidase Clan CA family C2 n=1 Tax=Leptomonas seymouri TaxID=5684 RepID=A0A0N1P9P7_LEPSE|nr:putative calpain-like cysteine peptidase putative cysteine peptidase Clan CA family C2 [Leptomonas seymouri]|eukprot:KPI82608.1 putative calpain-like cysteine peptidase putative cysteine peptidase Clan CA family C2 [Leptomonas seymouri]
MLPTILTILEHHEEELESRRPIIARHSVSQELPLAGASVIDYDEIDFRNGKPSYEGHRIFKCFKSRSNGLLFRVVNDSELCWAFYNDMSDYNVKIRCTVGAKSHVKPLGKTTMTTNKITGEKVLEVSVRPCETELFLDGVTKGFRLCYEAHPIPRAECLARKLKISDVDYISANLQGITDDDSQRRESVSKETLY